MFESLIHDLRRAIRGLLRSPRLSLAIVATLALAIGAAATLVSLLNAIVLRPLPIRSAERLVALSLTDAGGEVVRSFYFDTYLEFAASQQVFDQTFAYSGGGVFEIEARGALVDGNIAAATPGIFDVLGVRPQIGRLFTRDDAPDSGEPVRVVVLGHAMWRRLYGGDPRAIGQPLVVSGTPLTVIGVLPEGVAGLHIDTGADFYVPLTLLRTLSGNPNRPIRMYNIIGRLREQAALDQARAAILAAWPALQSSTLAPGLSTTERAAIESQRLKVESVSAGFSSLRRRYERPLALLAGLAAVLVVLGGLNLSGLLLARAVGRTHEFAVSLAIGASRGRLVRLLTLESVLLSAAGALAAALVAWLASRAIGAMLWTGVTAPMISFAPDRRVWLVLSAVAMATGLLMAVLPALHGARTDPGTALQRGRTTLAGMGRAGRTLLVAQVALSFVLIVGAGLFAVSLAKLRALDSGFTAPGVLFMRLFQLPGPIHRYDEASHNRALVERLSALPGVQSVGLSQIFPSYFNFTTPPVHDMARVDARDAHTTIDGPMDYVSPRFFETIGARLLRGRDFTWADRGGSPEVAIVNQTLAAMLYPGADAIGQRLRVGAEAHRQSLEIVGVVADVTIGNLRAPHLPVVFRPRLQEPQFLRQPIVSVRARGETAAIAGAIAPTVRSLGHEYVRRIYVLDQHVEESLLQERLLAGASACLGGVSALLAAIGLYALLARALHAVCARSACAPPSAPRGRTS